VLDRRPPDSEHGRQLAIGGKRLARADQAQLDLAPNLLGDGLVRADLLDALEAGPALHRRDGHLVPPTAAALSRSESTSCSTARTVSAIRSTMSESSSSVEVKAGAISVWSPA
jgi:hypothetical protein